MDRIETELRAVRDLTVIWSNAEVLKASAVTVMEEEDQEPSNAGTVELKVISHGAAPLSRRNHSKWEMRNPRCCEPGRRG